MTVAPREQRSPRGTSIVRHYLFQNFAELDNCPPAFSATAMQDAISRCSWPAMNPIANAFSACFLARFR